MHAVEQVARRAGVVAVILERIAHRFRYDGIGGEVHDGIDLVLSQHAVHQLAVADVADDQRRIAHRLAKAGVEIVEHHHALAARLQLQQHMAADVAGAAGDQDRFLGHCVRDLQRPIGWPEMIPATLRRIERRR